MDNAVEDKPRRLEDETAEYLAKIEIQFTDNLDNEDKSNLVENVIAEIAQRTASAACDRRTNYLVEKLCYAASLKNLLIICKRFVPYVLFLARNRYASHVLQAIMARLCYILKYEDFGDCDTDDVRETLESICQPIMKEMNWLILEQSASHVIRSMFSLLIGIPAIAERKGKNSKHQHSIALSEPLEALVEPKLGYISKTVAYSVPHSFHDIAIQSVESLLAMSTKDLERLIADFSSSAVLGFLVRILSSPGLLYNNQGPALANRLFSLALGWDALSTLALNHSTTTTSTTQSEPTELVRAVAVGAPTQGIFYAMAGDRAGSYFLEAFLECCSAVVFVSIVEGSLSGRCGEYVEDGSGNYVLQAVLRRMSYELAVVVHGKQQQHLRLVARRMVQELVDSTYFETMVNVKGGVTLWLLAVVRELTLASSACDSDHDDALLSEAVGMKVIHAWLAQYAKKTNDEDISTAAVAAPTAAAAEGTVVTAEGVDEQALLSKFLSERFALPERERNANNTGAGFVAKKNNKKKGKPSAAGEGDDVAAVPGASTQLLIARLLGELLQSSSRKVASFVARAFAHIDGPALQYVTTSGAVSRAVLDVYMNAFAQTPEFKMLGVQLVEIGVSLAMHYVGQHVVRQFFELADVRGKEKWAMTLTQHENYTQLSRSKEGSSSLRLVNAELYIRDPTEWRSAVKRKIKAESILKELDAKSSAVATAGAGAGAGDSKTVTVDKVKSKKKARDGENRTTAAADGDDVAMDDNDDNEDDDDNGNQATGKSGGGGGRKRKRKRPNKSNNVMKITT